MEASDKVVQKEVWCEDCMNVVDKDADFLDWRCDYYKTLCDDGYVKRNTPIALPDFCRIRNKYGDCPGFDNMVEVVGADGPVRVEEVVPHSVEWHSKTKVTWLQKIKNILGF